MSPAPAPPPSLLRRFGFHVGWAVAWGLVGTLVALGIVFAWGGEWIPVLQMSVLFAQVVGFTALISARVVFPLFARLPWAVSLPLQVLTLLSASVFGSAAALLVQPLFSVARPQIVAVIVLVNALLAVIVGIALHTYDRMRRQIADSYETLRRKEALEREIEIARDVQRQLLPRQVPRLAGLELAAVCRPAVGVGGDFYDFLVHAEDGMAIVVADVCGKGIPAALLMAGLQASVRSVTRPGASPAAVNHQLNQVLHDATPDARYATLFLALWDGRRRELTYSNAGHYPPVLLGAHGVTRLAVGGLPIGALPGSTYAEARCAIEPNDLLALFTDGIVEAPDPRGEEFGTARLERLLAAHGGRPLDDLILVVLDEIERWTEGATAHDDLTLVLARAT